MKSYTHNGAATLASSGSACLDLFFVIGASRGKQEQLVPMFHAAMEEDLDVALRILLWARDIRGGAGERQAFRVLVKELEGYEVIKNIIDKIPEVGRFDDLLVFNDEYTKELAFAKLASALKDGNALAAKWIPRQDRTGGYEFRKFLGMQPKQYRKMLVELSNTVEQKLSAGLFTEIEYAKLPSKAIAKYSKSFYKRSGGRFEAYLEQVKKGDAKINAGALTPLDVYRKWDEAALMEELWYNLPNPLEGNNYSILPVADVSGSMFGVPMEVSVSLTTFIAERCNNPAFKNKFISFSGRPNFHSLDGCRTLLEKFARVSSSGEDMSTNLQGVFTLLLDLATNKRHGHALPDAVLIISDMEFNEVNGTSWRSGHTTNFEAIKTAFRKANVKLPQLIFWNVNGRAGNVAANKDEPGVTLVSGYSPSILKSIFNTTTPFDAMLETVMVDRYCLGDY